MQRKSFYLLFLICFFSPFSPSAEEIRTQSLEKLIKFSGLGQMASDFPALINEGLKEAGVAQQLTEKEYLKLTMVLNSAYAPEVILATITKEVKTTISEIDAKMLLEWYESETGKKISLAEKRSANAEAFQEMLNKAEAMRQDKEKLLVVKRLDQLLKTTDTTMRVRENIGIAIITALQNVANSSSPISVDTYKVEWTTKEKEIREVIHEMVITSLLYSYQELSVKELKDYVNFNEDEKTLSFTQCIQQGLTKVFNDSNAAIAASGTSRMESKQ